MKLHENLIKACSAYVSEFAKMYEWENENEPMERNGIYHFADMTFTFEDIVYCVNNKVDKKRLIEWYDENCMAYLGGRQTVNLDTWVKYFNGFKK